MKEIPFHTRKNISLQCDLCKLIGISRRKKYSTNQYNSKQNQKKKYQKLLTQKDFFKKGFSKNQFFNLKTIKEQEYDDI